MAKIRIVKSPKYKSGGQIEPLSDSTFMFKGPSHADGGIPISYGGRGVEVEGGEPATIGDDGSLVIYGNMQNPLTGNKFKNDSKMLAKKEKRVDKLLDYSTELVNKSNPYDKWDALKFNSGQAMMTGAKLKKDELQQSRAHLSDLQQAMLQLKDEGHADILKNVEARRGAKNGLKMDCAEKAQFGLWMGGNPIEHSGRVARAKKLPTASLDTQDVYGQPDTTSTPDLSLAQKHNNPGNMKYEPWMQKFGATPGQTDNTTGDGTTYAQFPDMQSGMSAMREKLFNRPTFSNLSLKQAINKWTGNHPYSNIPSDLANKRISQMSPDERERAFSVITMGEDSKVYNRIQPGGSSIKPLESQIYTPENIHFDQLQTPQLNPINQQSPNRQSTNPYQYNWNLQSTDEIQAPTDAEGLQLQQILPEAYAAATNKEQDVWMQKYNPQLFQPFQESFQDRRNQITSQGRASRQYIRDNPSAQSTLASQEYDALSNVGADEFRTNQAISNDITNKNIGLLNDATLKNLQLADTQYTRQSLAKSKTKAANQDILNSLSSKLLQNQLENRTLQTYENLYPHFRYNDQYQLKKEGTPGWAYLNTQPAQLPQSSSLSDNTSTQQTMDANGNLKSTKYSTPSSIKNTLDELRLKDAREKAFGGEYRNLQKLFNSNK